ncbi:MAG: hypothetical protein IPM13_18555 [Phycisphaerales bacterium]|nr:hypothetical protein [Phycisphaerales bacterium]
MTRREKHDEVFWDDLLEEIDLEGTDLAAAEARMSAAEDVPLAPGQAEKMVRHATHGVPVLRLRERKVRGWTKAAAVLLGSALLTAATVAVLVWAVGRDSRDTMSYEQQIELLAREDQPVEHRLSAMGWVGGRIAKVIDTLTAIRNDTASPPNLADGASSGLSWIASLLSVEPPPIRPTLGADVELEATLARDGSLDAEVRLRAVGRLIEAAAGEISALRSMPTTVPDLLDSRSKTLARFRALLNRWTGISSGTTRSLTRCR